VKNRLVRVPRNLSNGISRKSLVARKTAALVVAFCFFAVVPASAAFAVEADVIPIDESPTAVAISPDGLFAYVLMYGDGNTALTIIDTVSHSTDVIQLEGDSQDGDVAVSPDGKTIYVADEDDDSVEIIDALTHAVTVVDGFSSPQGIAVSPDGSTVYVANSSSNTLDVMTNINTSQQTYTIMPIAVGQYPLGVAVSPDGSTVYVANNDEDTLSVITDINVSGNTFSHTNVPVGVRPTDVAVSPDGSTIYVTNNGDWSTPNSGSVSIVNALSLATSAPLTGYDETVGIAVSPSGSNIVFSSLNRVTIVNTVTGAETGFDITGNLKGVAISPNGSTAYIANAYEPNPPGGSISVLPLAALQPATAAKTNVGTPYTFSIPSFNATSFSVTAGSLPTGLSLNATTGAITGTPTANGTATFTITAVGELNSDIRSYSITVAPVLAATGLNSGAVPLIAGISLLLLTLGLLLRFARARTNS
jgi:YVTN family beta-propeller protein